jgi:hypothetical protein
MKTTSKKILMILLVGVILFPTMILAQTSNQSVEQKLKNFCFQISSLTSKIDQKITGIGDKLGVKRVEISNKIEERRDNREMKLEQVRDKWDVNREEHFVKLEEKAKTDEQKQAVINFKKAVNDAISVRRLAIDLAIQNFKTGVDQAIASRKAAINALEDNYESAVKTAIAKATTDCASGVLPATIRQNLTNDLKTARDKFTSERKEVDKTKEVKDQLIATKKAAFEKAINDFKIALEKAKTDLKAAFSKQGTTTED